MASSSNSAVALWLNVHEPEDCALSHWEVIEPVAPAGFCVAPARVRRPGVDALNIEPLPSARVGIPGRGTLRDLSPDLRQTLNTEEKALLRWTRLFRRVARFLFKKREWAHLGKHLQSYSLRSSRVARTREPWFQDALQPLENSSMDTQWQWQPSWNYQ